MAMKAMKRMMELGSATVEELEQAATKAMMELGSAYRFEYYQKNKAGILAQQKEYRKYGTSQKRAKKAMKTTKAMKSAGTQAVSPKRFREGNPPHDYDDVKTKCHDDDLTQGLEETKHHDDLTKYHDDDLIKYHDDDPGHAGLQETKHSTTTTHLTRTVTVRAGSIVHFLDPRDTTKVIKQVRIKKDLQLTVHRKPNDKEEKQEEEVV